jgi:hypothetical protein
MVRNIDAGSFKIERVGGRFLGLLAKTPRIEEVVGANSLDGIRGGRRNFILQLNQVASFLLFLTCSP